MDAQPKASGDFNIRNDCRFCHGKNLVKILDFGYVPLAGGFLKKEEFADEKYYPLELDFCSDCSLIQVSTVVSAETLFKNYFYFSSSIGTLVEHMAEFARETKDRFLRDIDKPAVFELGCNDGVLLKPFATMGIKAVGIDPATNVVNSIDSKNITVLNDYFTENAAGEIREKHGLFDAVLSSYSFAHIDDMDSVMKGVKLLLQDQGVFIFEVYYLGTLMDEIQYDMIYHEHMSYYSLRALSIFLKKYDMEVFDIRFMPGVRSGAVRFYAQNIGQRKDKKTGAVSSMEQYEKDKGFHRAETYLDYARKVNNTKRQLLDLLDKLKKDDKTIIGYGASGRGTTIMNYCGIDKRYLDYVVDDAPAKHGFSTPGTHVPIKPWDYTKETVFPEYALLFAWSFINEVKKRRSEYLKQGGKFIVPLPDVKVVSE